MELQQVWGATQDNSGTMKIGFRTEKYLVTYGYVEGGKTTVTLPDGTTEERQEAGYDYECMMTHKPTEEEVRNLIIPFIDRRTDEKILNGFRWNGNPVYLSTENQMNYKAVYDLAVQTNGSVLPVKVKLGEESDGTAVYFTFEDIATFSDFYTKAVSHISACLNEGWAEKDAIDWERFVL